MGYGLGIDLGTTWTAAAIARPGGEPHMVALGGRTAVIPTVVYVGPDGTTAVGDAAERRAATDPDRVAREFKRRIGDTVPTLLGGQPWSAEALLVLALQWVLARVTEQEGGPPDQIVVTRPANWGPLRRELLEQAVGHAGVKAEFVTEPEAAAIHYAAAARVPEGSVVAVYDLGGGTFDATVLRKEQDGFSVLGKPEGVERLGGLDFDAAVVGHIGSVLGPSWRDLTDDAVSRAAVHRLRQDCVAAKEALSEDPDVSIPVQLPTVATEVRLTRAELEGMIRPSIEQSADALERAIAGAGVSVADVDRVLLAGGSSRIPLVSQVLATRLGRPVALDAHPKHAVALGAARLAAASSSVPTAGPVPPVTPPPPAPTEPPAVERKPRRRGWPIVAGVGAVVVAAIVAALVLAGGGSGEDLIETSDATGTITLSVPERWSSVGPLPFGFPDSAAIILDVVAATDEAAFASTLAIGGIDVSYANESAIDEFGVLGDPDALVQPLVDDADLENVCDSEDEEETDAEVGGFLGTLRTFNDCGGAVAVQVFGGFDDDGAGLQIITHLVDEDDEAVIDSVLDSIDIDVGDHSEPQDPADVTVQILDGADLGGAADEQTGVVADAGYDTVDPATLDETVDVTEVYAAEGWEVDAVAVAIALGLDPIISSFDDVEELPEGVSEDADVVIVLGSDF